MTIPNEESLDSVLSSSAYTRTDRQQTHFYLEGIEGGIFARCEDGRILVFLSRLGCFRLWWFRLARAPEESAAVHGIEVC